MDGWLETGAPCVGPEAPRARVARDGEAVVIVDVDQFAAIRSRHGRPAAEQVTHAVADCLRRRLRPGDRLALLRDEEFLAVLQGASESTLPSITARLRSGVSSLRIALAGEVWTLTCTVGAAAHSAPRRGLDCLVRAADSALYHARHGAAAARHPG